jgi:hypothetical protein
MTHIAVSNESEHAMEGGVYLSSPTRRTNPRLHKLCCARLASAFLPKLGPFFACSFCATRSPEWDGKTALGISARNYESFPLEGKESNSTRRFKSVEIRREAR